jgi:hypothetical protein
VISAYGLFFVVWPSADDDFVSLLQDADRGVDAEFSGTSGHEQPMDPA